MEALGQGSEPSRIEERECAGCGKPFQCNIVKIGAADFSRKYCDSCSAAIDEQEKKEQAAQMERDIEARRGLWRQNSGMTGELSTKTFENFEGGRETVKKAKEWAADFDIEKPHGAASLIFYSDRPGLGKTHLMSAIANYVINNWHGDPDRVMIRPIRFESGPGLVRRIRSTYNLPPDSTHEREEDVYNQLMGVRLLLLDDVGKESPSKFTRETYWYIIDERLKNNLPVIISSRLELGALENLMGEDTVDRLYGMVKGEMIVLKGTSYRRRKLKA